MNYRITEWFELQGTSKPTDPQAPARGKAGIRLRKALSNVALNTGSEVLIKFVSRTELL